MAKKNSYNQKGGKLKVGHIKQFLKSSYDKQPTENIDDFILDKSLSNDYAKTYYDPLTNHSVVVHRGTSGASDWLNNVAYAFGAYNFTNRYKTGKEIQERAEEKYGSQNVSTLGHSQGGVLARKLGGNSKEIINLNPAYMGESQNQNEFNVRSDRDLVSGMLAPFNAVKSWFYPTNTSNRNIVIPSKSFNILTEHSPDILDRLYDDDMIGAGISNPHFKIRKGGAISRGNGLYDTQIINMLKNYKKFGGVYPKDVLPKTLKKDYWYVANMDNHTGQGTHYVAFKNSSPMIYFDPLIGGDPPIEIMTKAKDGILYYDKEVQPVLSTACGWYSTACILSDKKGNSVENFKRFMNSFSNNNINNDIILKKILHNEGVI